LDRLKNVPLNPQRIVVRCPNWIGDAVMATPFLSELRETYPNAEITFMLREYVKEVYSGAPWADKYVITKNKQRTKFLKRRLNSIVENIQMLKNGNYDLAVLLSNSFESAFEARTAGIPNRIGYRRNGRGFLITSGPKAVRRSGVYEPVSMIDYYNELGKYLGFRKFFHDMALFLSPEDECKTNAVMNQFGIDESSNLIGLNLGAAFGSSKLWKPEYFAQVGDYFARNPKNKVMLLAGPNEDIILDKISAMMQYPKIKLTSDLVPIGVLKGIIKRLSLLITNDTGPRHFASSFGIPSVVLIGATNPRWTTNNDSKQIVLMKVPVCGPCHLRNCPMNHQCMRNIKPADVVQAAEKLLGSPIA